MLNNRPEVMSHLTLAQLIANCWILRTEFGLCLVFGINIVFIICVLMIDQRSSSTVRTPLTTPGIIAPFTIWVMGVSGWVFFVFLKNSFSWYSLSIYFFVYTLVGWTDCKRGEPHSSDLYCTGRYWMCWTTRVPQGESSLHQVSETHGVTPNLTQNNKNNPVLTKDQA